ncbi:MAG: glycosyltransferase [Bryobacteraceae bacterium]|jgi:chlorobactene glucosyltransferase
MKPATSARNLENPFEPSASRPLLAIRFLCVALSVGAVISGYPLLEWLSVPAMLWVLVVVWGRHVLFAENLAALPNLSAAAGPAAPSLPPTVSLIVPARNEAIDIESAVRALAAIDYPALEILIIDDHSSDATLDILRRLAREFQRLRVLSAPDVPPGWTGKTNASWFGFEQADPRAQWLLFTDARVKFHPLAVRCAVAHAEAKQLGFLSCIIRFEGEGLPEELIAILQNRGLVISARAFGGGAPVAPFGLGAFSLIRRDVYMQCGGHALWPDHPLEDFMLAKSARDSGAVTSAAIASELISIRRYHGVADMRRRIVRTLRVAASDHLVDLVNRISLELLLGVLPLPLAIGALARMVATRAIQPTLGLLCAIAFLAWLAGACTPRTSIRICRFRGWVVWLHPLGAALWTWLLVLAIGERIRGRKISWRGRPIHPPSPAAP